MHPMQNPQAPNLRSFPRSGSVKPMATSISLPIALSLFLCLQVLTVSTSATAEDESAATKAAQIKQGRAKAQGCTRCHGRHGMQQFARRSDWDYSISTFVVKQLLLFRGNRRKHEIMNAVAKPLSNIDIYEIALWYESVSKTD